MDKVDDTIQHTIDGTKPAHIAVNGSPPVLFRCIYNSQRGGEGSDLEKAVLAGQAPPDFGDPARYQETVQAVLTHLAQRLKAGLDDAWGSVDGYQREPAEWGKPGEDLNTLEEQWARAFSEMAVFAAYGGIGNNHGFSAETEMTLYSWFDKTQRATPGYPIMLACQHLSTYLVLSRGIPAAQVAPNGMSAGAGTGGLPLFKEKKLGVWTNLGEKLPGNPSPADAASGKTSKQAPSALGPLRDIPLLVSSKTLTPGSVFAYNSLGVKATEQSGKAHIGSVLRIWGGGMQPIDTGPLGGDGHSDDGCTDHDLQLTNVDAGSILNPHIVSVGCLDAAATAPTQADIDYIKKARPLGFAQLVLADRDKKIRFVSRLMPMYSGSDNFSVARFAWSLRGFPANLTPIWILSIAQNPGLTRDLLEGKAVKDMHPRDRNDKPQTPDKQQGLWGYPLVPTHVILGEPCAQVPDHEGFPAFRLSSRIRLFRRKLGPTSAATGSPDNWKEHELPERPGDARKAFPEALSAFHFDDLVTGVKGSKLSMSWWWRRSQLDSPCWTMKDPGDKANPQVTDITKDIPYFGDGA